MDKDIFNTKRVYPKSECPFFTASFIIPVNINLVVTDEAIPGIEALCNK